jgi:hypothetical protein
MRSKLKVKVVAYNDRIVIVPLEPDKDLGDGWFPAGGGRIGCVLLDTKKSLGLSEEALALMPRMKRNHDDMGDLDWFACHDGTYAFSWFGVIHRVIDPENSERARNFFVSDRLKSHCTIIPNDVPEAAKLAIDADSSAYSWAEPRVIDVKLP